VTLSLTWLFSLSVVVVSLVLVYVNNFNDKIGYCEKSIIKLKVYAKRLVRMWAPNRFGRICLLGEYQLMFL
jgi:uncharacterized membrane protein